MSKVLFIFLALTTTAIFPAYSQEENLELMNAAIFVESRQFVVSTWEDHCVKLNPFRAQYFKYSASEWAANNSRPIMIADKILSDFKINSAEAYNAIKVNTERSINGELAAHDIEDRLEHCDTFFRRVAENQQDIENINPSAHTLLLSTN